MLSSKDAFVLLVIAAACAPVRQNPASAIASPSASTPYVAVAQWSYALSNGMRPANNSPEISGGMFVVAGRDEILSGSARTGVVWRRSGAYISAQVANGAVFIVNRAGDVRRLRLSDGKSTWQAPAVCGRDHAGQHYLRAVAADIFIGCSSGELVRLRAQDGTVLARAAGMTVDRYVDIEELPEHTLYLSGWASGAALRSYMSIIDFNELRTILQQREDVALLGTVGSNAILNDTCCQGRPDVYRPATIFSVALPGGQVSQPVDLRPDPQLFPADRRPIGQNSLAALINRQLYLAVPPMLYNYGYPGLLASTPTRVLKTLEQLPTFLPNGYVYVRLRTSGNGLLDELLDFHERLPRVVWSGPVTDPLTNTMYDPRSARAVIALTKSAHGTTFIRVSDGNAIVTRTACSSFASDNRYVVAVCSSKAGKTFLDGFAFRREDLKGLPGSPPRTERK